MNEMFYTNEKFPKYQTDVLVWYPPGGYWVIGRLHKGVDRFGDYFKNVGVGAWYLHDGITAWMKLPKTPRLFKNRKKGS